MTYELDLAALRTRAERSHRMSVSDPSDPDRHTIYSDVLVLLDMLDEAHSALHELESALSWGTTCLNCSAVLTSSYDSYVRAERAEALLEDYVSSVGYWRERAVTAEEALAVSNNTIARDFG